MYSFIEGRLCWYDENYLKKLDTFDIEIIQYCSLSEKKVNISFIETNANSNKSEFSIEIPNRSCINKLC